MLCLEFLCANADNEIDGETFLELTESEIKSLVSKLGVFKKIMRLKSKV